MPIDAHAISGQQGGSSASLTITTTGTADIIIVAIWEGGSDTAAWAVTDSQGHLSFNRRYPISAGTSTLFTLFYATATATLTSDAIQVSGSPGLDWGFAVIAISGVNTSTPLDLAATAVGSNATNPSVTYNTSNANDMLVGWIYNGFNAANPGLGASYNAIDNANWSNIGWEADEYEVVSSSGSQTTGWSGGVGGFPYAEAVILQSAAAAGGYKGASIIFPARRRRRT
jgi:phage tail sheath gpL-like